MLTPSVIGLLMLATSAVDARRDYVTLESLLLKHCTVIAASDVAQLDRPERGPRGIRGWPGYSGEKGQAGQGGPPGYQNDTEIREIFDGYLEAVFRTLTWSVTLGVQLESCEDVGTKLAQVDGVLSGIYEIYHPVLGWTNVYCDLEDDQGAWTVFQRRMDGSVDFHRGWGDYVHGFGDKYGEFWLGLEKIHQMIKEGGYEMRVDMISTEETPYFIHYSSFYIGPSQDNYRVAVAGYSGNASDAFAERGGPYYHQNHHQFSTKDFSNHEQTYTPNCAQRVMGAWWYSQCLGSKLNGLYRNYTGGVAFGDKREKYQFMKFVEMKFRRKRA